MKEAFRAFVRELIKTPYSASKPRRVDFYLKPNEVMCDFEDPTHRTLSDKEKAVLISLDYLKIAHYADDVALAAEIEAFNDYNETDHDWPPPGSAQWNPWNNGDRCGPSPKGDLKILWAGPDSGIAWVFSDGIYVRPAADVKLAGEGILREATVVLTEQQSPYRAFSAVADYYLCCNIRRTYISASIPIGDATPGFYSLSVQNTAWKKHKLEWRIPFEIR